MKNGLYFGKISDIFIKMKPELSSMFCGNIVRSDYRGGYVMESRYAK